MAPAAGNQNPFERIIPALALRRLVVKLRCLEAHVAVARPAKHAPHLAEALAALEGIPPQLLHVLAEQVPLVSPDVGARVEEASQLGSSGIEELGISALHWLDSSESFFMNSFGNYCKHRSIKVPL
jgi:hypothetical protein